MKNIYPIDTYQLQMKKSKDRKKSDDCKSLFLHNFIDDDITKNYSDDHSNIKITDVLKLERISEIHYIKIRTLNYMILNFENMVRDMREIQRLLIFLDLLNVC
jgi:hypothetical protein